MSWCRSTVRPTRASSSDEHTRPGHTAGREAPADPPWGADHGPAEHDNQLRCPFRPRRQRLGRNGAGALPPGGARRGGRAAAEGRRSHGGAKRCQRPATDGRPASPTRLRGQGGARNRPPMAGSGHHRPAHQPPRQSRHPRQPRDSPATAPRQPRDSPATAPRQPRDSRRRLGRNHADVRTPMARRSAPTGLPRIARRTAVGHVEGQGLTATQRLTPVVEPDRDPGQVRGRRADLEAVVVEVHP